MASSSGALSGTEPDSESDPDSIGPLVESQHASGASTSEESDGVSEPNRGERELQWGEWEPQLEDFDLSTSSVSNSDEDSSDAEGAGLPRMPRMPTSSSDSESSSDYSDSGYSSFESDSSDADSDAEWEPEHFMLYLLQGQLKEPLSPTSREMTAVWALLPEEVLERVFAMTPLASQCRFRVVSKAWRKRLSSLAFRQLCASVTRPPTRHPVICAMEHMPRSRPLRRSDLWLWGKTGNPEVLRVDASYLPAKFRACVSSMVVQGGMVCIYSTGECGGIREPSASFMATHQDRRCPHTAESRRSVVVVRLIFCVVNPVTAAWKELPPEPVVNDGYEQRTLEGSWRVLLEVEKGINANFKVIVVSTRPSMLWKFKNKATLSIYSSSSDSWEVVHLASPGPPLKRLADGRDEDLRRWPQTAICKGQLFSMDWQVLNVHSLPTGKFVSQTCFQGLYYPPYRGRPQFKVVDDSNLDGLRSVYGIFAHSERLFCVGEGLMGKAQRFGIWELDTTMNLWFMTSFLPIKLENEVMSRSLNRLSLRRGTLVGATLWLAFHLSSSRNVGVLPRHTVFIGYHFPSDSWNLQSKGWPSIESYDVFQILQPGNLGFEQCVQAAMLRKAKTLAEENDVDVTT